MEKGGGWGGRKEREEREGRGEKRGSGGGEKRGREEGEGGGERTGEQVRSLRVLTYKLMSI